MTDKHDKGEGSSKPLKATKPAQNNKPVTSVYAAADSVCWPSLFAYLAQYTLANETSELTLAGDGNDQPTEQGREQVQEIRVDCNTK